MGRTSGTLRSRCNGHRQSLKTKKGPVHLVSHFTKVHRPGDLCIKPIERVEGTLEMMNAREDYWIKELGTLYPYGLNERLNKPYIDAHNYVLLNYYIKINLVEESMQEGELETAYQEKQQLLMICSL